MVTTKSTYARLVPKYIIASSYQNFIDPESPGWYLLLKMFYGCHCLIPCPRKWYISGFYVHRIRGFLPPLNLLGAVSINGNQCVIHDELVLSTARQNPVSCPSRPSTGFDRLASQWAI